MELVVLENFTQISKIMKFNKNHVIKELKNHEKYSNL